MLDDGSDEPTHVAHLCRYTKLCLTAHFVRISKLRKDISQISWSHNRHLNVKPTDQETVPCPQERSEIMSYQQHKIMLRKYLKYISDHGDEHLFCVTAHN